MLERRTVQHRVVQMEFIEVLWSVNLPATGQGNLEPRISRSNGDEQCSAIVSVNGHGSQGGVVLERLLDDAFESGEINRCEPAEAEVPGRRSTPVSKDGIPVRQRHHILDVVPGQTNIVQSRGDRALGGQLSGCENGHC